uniref:Radial spoke head 1 homolog n=1 Tax=Schistocephalus solidus TaxID=70667 RepID=A0A0X3NWV3_SCHSO
MSDDEEGMEEEGGPYLGEYEGGRNERNERHGDGKAILPNHDTYEGHYCNGLRNGKGFYKFKNGARYFGYYLDNRKHGPGDFYYLDGSVYKGNWADDKRNGIGTYYYINGDCYEGEWRNHLRHGQGKYTFAATGLVYSGLWKEGKMDGWGELIHEKYRFIGIWKDGKLLGKGRYIFDKLNCQQKGEYVLTPAAPEEKRPDDEGENVTISRWKGQTIEKITEDDVKPKAYTEADATLEQPNYNADVERQTTESSSKLVESILSSTVPAFIVDSSPEAIDLVEDDALGDASKNSPIDSTKEEDGEPAELQDLEEN